MITRVLGQSVAGCRSEKRVDLPSNAPRSLLAGHVRTRALDELRTSALETGQTTSSAFIQMLKKLMTVFGMRSESIASLIGLAMMI